MKILHIVPTYVPAYRYGGPIESVHNLNVGLVKAGADVTVYTTNIDGFGVLDMPLNREINMDGVKIWYFPITFRPWQYSYNLHKFLVKNAENFDLIHITSVFLSISTLGAYYAKKLKKPYVISPRGNLMISPLNKGRMKWFKKWLYILFIERRNLRDADVVHFTVSSEKDDYIKNKFPYKRLIVLPNIINASRFNRTDIIPAYLRNRFNLQIDKKIVLYLGRLNWIKGFDTLIPSFKKVIEKEPKAVLIIVGGDDNGYKKSIVDLIEKNNLVEFVLFTGALTGNEKKSALSDSDLFILPSYSESFGMAAIEAMFFEVPVIVTEGVGIASIIKKAKAGIVIKKDEKELSRAIIAVLSNMDKFKEMRKLGKRLVEREFSQNRIAKQFIMEYRMIINGYKK